MYPFKAKENGYHLARVDTVTSITNVPCRGPLCPPVTVAALYECCKSKTCGGRVLFHFAQFQ